MKLMRASVAIVIQWIPAHCDIYGNELADAAAKAATSLDEPQTEISFSSICSHIKARIVDNPNKHERTAEVYASLSKRKENKVTSRSDQVLLARIRSGHHWLFESYHKMVDPTHDAKCKEYGAKLHDLEHWFRFCPSTSHIRQRIFGTTDVELDLLSSDPTRAIAFTAVAAAPSKASTCSQVTGHIRTHTEQQQH